LSGRIKGKTDFVADRMERKWQQKVPFVAFWGIFNKVDRGWVKIPMTDLIEEREIPNSY